MAVIHPPVIRAKQHQPRCISSRESINEQPLIHWQGMKSQIGHGRCAFFKSSPIMPGRDVWFMNSHTTLSAGSFLVNHRTWTRRTTCKGLVWRADCRWKRRSQTSMRSGTVCNEKLGNIKDDGSFYRPGPHHKNAFSYGNAWALSNEPITVNAPDLRVTALACHSCAFIERR